MLRTRLFILIVSLMITADPPKDVVTKKDKERLQGEWLCETIEASGMNLVGQDFQDVKFDLVFKPDKLIVKSKAKTDNWDYRLDSTSNPKSMDLTYEEGGQKVTAKAIFHLEGDDLTICWSIPEHERPKEFKSKPKTSLAVIVFKRARN
jgi:uncharacterized protein (TIGR03067 family)